MKHVKYLMLGLGLLAWMACRPGATPSAEASPEKPPIPETQSDNPFVASIETAHRAGSFRSHPAISADLVLSFRGKERLRGQLSFLTSTGKLRIDEENGLTTVFDGENVYLSPDSIDPGGARFGIFTWTYFMALPYKLSDPGTVWAPTPHNRLQDKTYDSQKLTFTEGTGDSSLDWYIVYADPETHLVEAAAYIVTYTNSVDQAEVDPHAITYSDYEEVDGIPIATQWKFWTWRENEGLTEQLGSAQLSNIHFVEDTGDLFDRPANSQVVEYPGNKQE